MVQTGHDLNRHPGHLAKPAGIVAKMRLQGANAGIIRVDEKQRLDAPSHKCFDRVLFEAWFYAITEVRCGARHDRSRSVDQARNLRPHDRGQVDLKVKQPLPHRSLFQ